MPDQGYISNTFNDLFTAAVFGPYLSRMQRLILLVSQIAAELLDADAGNVWLVRNAHLHLAVIINRPVTLLETFVLDCKAGLNAEVVKTARPVLSKDVQKDPRAAKPEVAHREGLRSFVGAPVLVGNNCIGVVSLFGRTPGQFTSADLQTLTWLTNMLGLAIHHCSIALGAYEQWERALRHLVESPVRSLSVDGPDRAKKRANPVWVLTEPVPKGIHPLTLAKVHRFVLTSGRPISCEDVSKGVSVSVVTARRYLSYLHDSGAIERHVSYSGVGRPTYLYEAVDGRILEPK
ncbi:MAG TPA: GAF domain-containing protein [Firmicutes bacterium]|nr:GAF domain-containing protein [Candidatus Fermentithermobacillaceae bacterium]